MSNFKFHTIETAPEGSKAILEGAQKQMGMILAFTQLWLSLQKYLMRTKSCISSSRIAPSTQKSSPLCGKP